MNFKYSFNTNTHYCWQGECLKELQTRVFLILVMEGKCTAHGGPEL